jgi:hypothetical protein
MCRHRPENKECIYCIVEEREMDAEWKPGDDDVKTVLEAHDLLPEGPLLEEALGLTSLYADRVRELLAQLPASSNRQKAVLAILEEGLMQEGIIPNSHERKFKMPDEARKT